VGKYGAGEVEAHEADVQLQATETPGEQDAPGEEQDAPGEPEDDRGEDEEVSPPKPKRPRRKRSSATGAAERDAA
jgi:hypothetical protein